MVLGKSKPRTIAIKSRMTMETTDLMIGDWVLISVWDCKPFPSKVTSINYNSYQGKDFVDWIDTEDEEDIGMYDVQPIPLTAEILEKNFGEPVVDIEPNTQLADYRYTMGSLGDICNTCYITGYNIEDRSQTQGKICVCRENGAWMFYIRYVHELQHALRLCGIDKEITL